MMLFNAQFFSESKKASKTDNLVKRRTFFPGKNHIFQEQLFVKKAIISASIIPPLCTGKM